MEETEENYLIVRGRVKLFLRDNGKRIAGESYEALDQKLKSLLLEAVKRAERNKRSTIMPYDL